MTVRHQVQRLHPRYLLGNPSLAWVSLDGIKIGHLLEIGFGGCAVEVNPQSQKKLEVLTVAGNGSKDIRQLTLHYLNTSYKLRIGRNASTGTRLGIEFYFEDTMAFDFVKSIIFPMRYGAATRYMQLNGLSSATDLPIDLGTGGDIPFKLSVDGVDGREIPFVSLSIRQDLVLNQFLREQSGIRTLHSIWPGAITGDLHDTDPLDQNILRAAFGFFWTYSNGDRSNVYYEIASEIMRILGAPITKPL
jgi:hypothetical protein